MGQPQIYYSSPIKRNDYKKEEIEKKYSNDELTKLVLYDYVFLYPPKKYFPNRLCEMCGQNPITKEFQLSDNKECMKCYEEVKKENFNYIMQCIKEEHYVFEGNCILENKLYLGGIRSSFLKEEMKKLGITHILMVGYFMTPLFPDDFIYDNIEVNDNKNENILKNLIKGIKFIDQSGVCYTHCQLGKSRSAAFSIAYVMYKNKIHFSEAFDFVQEKRYVAFPNEGFQCQLEDLDIIMSNFDYDLDKCDEFIKKFFENAENLIKSEHEYLQKRREKKLRDDSDDEPGVENDQSDKKIGEKKDENSENQKEQEKNEKKEEEGMKRVEEKEEIVPKSNDENIKEKNIEEERNKKNE